MRSNGVGTKMRHGMRRESHLHNDMTGECLRLVVSILRRNPQGLPVKVLAERTGYKMRTIKRLISKNREMFGTGGRGHDSKIKLLEEENKENE